MANDKLIEQLNKVLGEDGVQTQASRNEYYRKGFRSGSGSALAVVFPDSLTKLWQVLQACVEADVIINNPNVISRLTTSSRPLKRGAGRALVGVRCETDAILIVVAPQIE